MSKKLANKIALVTGASKGIGAGIAKALADEGATVVVNYSSSKAAAEKVVADIEKAGGKALAVQGDFSKPADIERVFGEIKSKQGRLDILVNNAGAYSFGAVADLTPEFFHKYFDLNVLGTMLSIKNAVPLMDKGGSIINIGSVVAKMAPAMGSVYVATKGAIDSLTISLSKELGPNQIRVNAVNPGLIVTEGTNSAGMTEGEFHEFMLKTTPLGRVGHPDDVAGVVTFLASEDSKWVNGQQIAVTGGQTM
jgi:3-oxoacyl-[acyl-carrier protein] reductase